MQELMNKLGSKLASLKAGEIKWIFTPPPVFFCSSQCFPYSENIPRKCDVEENQHTVYNEQNTRNLAQVLQIISLNKPLCLQNTRDFFLTWKSSKKLLESKRTDPATSKIYSCLGIPLWNKTSRDTKANASHQKRAVTDFAKHQSELS